MAVEGREANKRLKNYHEASEEELEEDDEDEEGEEDNRAMSSEDSSDVSTHSSRCGSPTYRTNGDKRKKVRNKNVNPKLNYKCIGYWKENHGHPIFGVSVNHHLDSSSPTVFATVGYNRVTIYEAMSGGIKLLQCYADPDTDENFYTCAWSYDTETGRPVLAAGGCRGIIR